MAIQAQLYSDNIGFPSCGSLDWIDNGCGVVGGAGFNQYGLGVQQLEQFQHHQNHHQRNPSLESMMFRQDMMSSQVENQRQEIDQFIKSQNERLRLLLQEQRKQEVAALMKKVESRACVLLRQKDEEIAKAEYKAMELQNMLKRLEMEIQAWQRMAQENEAMVVSLNNTLEQVRAQGYCRFDNGAADDAESCCECEGDKETEGNREKTTMACKGCYGRSSCVLFLPCRHLCSCRECAASLDSCPVCKAPKKASIEALVS